MATRKDSTGRLEAYHEETTSWVPVVAPLQPRTSTPIQIAETQYQLFEDLAALTNGISTKITELSTVIDSDATVSTAIKNKLIEIQGYIQVVTDSTNSLSNVQLPAILGVLQSIRNYSGNGATSSLDELIAAKNLLSQIGNNTNNSGTTLISEASAIKSAIDDVESDLSAIKGHVDTVEALISGNNTLLTASNSDVATIKGHVDTLETLIGTTNTELTAIKGFVDTVETLIGSGNTLQTTANTDIAAIKGHVDTVETLIGTTNTELTAIKGFVDTLETLLGTTNTELVAIKGFVDTVETLMGTSNTELTAIKGFVDTVETLISSNNTLQTTANTDIAAIKANTASGANTVLTRLTEIRDCFDWAVPLSLNSGSAILNAVTAAASSSFHALSANGLTLLLQWYATAFDVNINYVVELVSVSGSTALNNRTFYSRNMAFTTLEALTGNFAGVEPEIIEISGHVTCRVHLRSISHGAVTLFAREVKVV